MDQNADTRGPIVLIVRDGWGRNPNAEHDAFNAVKLARTPRCDALLREYPWVMIHTSGPHVGLPEGTMGNSEVGHQNLGAGRIVAQESVRITNTIESGTFFENAAIHRAVQRVKDNDATLHLLGIGSDVGVHGRLEHLYACVEAAARAGLARTQVAVHLFTDGRDSGPYTGKDYAAQVEANLADIGVGEIASVCGRYFAMDRDNRWERVRRAYDMLTGRTTTDEAPRFATAAAAITDYYEHPISDNQQGDEFITPCAIGDTQAHRVRDGDAVIFYNYRGDRPREMTRAFVLPDDQWANVTPSPDSGSRGFDRGDKLDVHYVTMTAYEKSLNDYVDVAFPKPPKMKDTAGEYLSRLGVSQFRCAETEKFPHVTFFYNDYRDEPFDGESREMAQSPKVATYDQQPEMSAHEVMDIVVGRVRAADGERYIVVNFANGDMVGHTGNLDATVKAVETVDACVGHIVDATLEQGGALIVTADHGNAEQMYDPATNFPQTAHTLYDVECILVDTQLRDAATGDPDRPSAKLRQDGRLADVIPTALDMMQLDVPAAMEGKSLLRP
jgi:2,3-bisphosphoglycerate-independent phosphoglycerate mutase